MPRKLRPDEELATRKARGERVASLREHFGLTQQIVADAAGIQRTQYVALEGGNYGWRSRKPVVGLAKTYGFTYEQFESFVDGELRLDDAIHIARPTVELLRKRLADEQQRMTGLVTLLAEADAKSPLVNGVREAVSAPKFAANLLDLPPRVAIAEIVRINGEFARALADMPTARPSGTRRTSK